VPKLDKVLCNSAMYVCIIGSATAQPQKDKQAAGEHNTKCDSNCRPMFFKH
jgi:hypothetical protein